MNAWKNSLSPPLPSPLPPDKQLKTVFINHVTAMLAKEKKKGRGKGWEGTKKGNYEVSCVKLCGMSKVKALLSRCRMTAEKPEGRGLGCRYKVRHGAMRGE